MPRNAAGNYALPLPPVVPGTTIAANVENTTDSDIASELTNSLDRNGRGGMLAPFKIFDGTVSAPGMAFTLDPDNGIYRIGNDDWGMAVAGTLAAELNAGGLTVWQGLAVHGATNFAGDTSVTLPGVFLAVGSTGGIADPGQGKTPLVVYGAAGAGDAAFMDFNRGGGFVSHFGLDTDNTWCVGGGSMGAVSYKLLHGGNAFTYDATHLYTSKAVYCGDVQASRGTVGVLYLGDQTGGPQYLSYSGGSFAFTTAPVLFTAKIAVNNTVVPPAVAFNVRVGPDFNINFLHYGNVVATIAAHNDALSGYQDLYVGPSNVFASVGDSTTSCGTASNRWQAVYAVNGVIQTSDARQKKNVAPSTLGLSFIEGLNPVSFQRITEKNVVTRVPDYEEQVPDTYDIDGNLIPAHTVTVYRDEVTPIPGTRTHWGLIAQDVKNAVTAAGVDFAGLYEDADPAVGMGLTYTEFIAPLIKAVQELSAKVAALEAA